MSDFNELGQQYDLLTNASGFAELPERSFISIAGEDRRKFLHNFCTNDIKELSDDSVCEAFVLNEKGKLLGYTHVIADDGQLLLTGHGQQSQILIDHLDKYIIRDDVELSNCSAETDELPKINCVSNGQFDSINIKLVHTELAGVGFLLICDASSIGDLKSTLTQAGIPECSLEALNTVRIKAKTPWFGIDADDSNLPQELQRDDIAISFDKGCYLGQETVARIDARGRVNQLLVGLEYTGDDPPSLGELVLEEKPVGRITSVSKLAAGDSESGAYIGLGYVRRQFKESGTRLGQWVVL